MNERIKQVRKALNLTQDEFGKRLGVTRGAITNIEYNKVEPKQLFVELLCREFHVSIDWLLTGEGPMFEDLPATLVDEMAETYHLDDMDKKIISAFLELSAQEREIIKKYLSSIFSEKKDLP